MAVNDVIWSTIFIISIFRNCLHLFK